MMQREAMVNTSYYSCLATCCGISLSILSGASASAQPAASPDDPNSAPHTRIDPPSISLPVTSGTVRVATKTITLPVIEGTGIRFARLSTIEGLSQTRVSQIVQDVQGFMWFGTQYGLNRFDGYTFKLFVNDPGNSNSLSGSFISALFKDRSGALWIACGEFLDRLDPATETFTHYPVHVVQHISQDSSGMLWLATGNGLDRLDPATGRIRKYAHDPNDPSSIGSNDVKSSREDRTGRFWVATKEGLDELDRVAGRVTLHVPLHEPLREFTVFEDRFGVLWIGHTSGTGLAVFDRQANVLTHYAFSGQQSTSAASNGVMAMLEDRTGDLWLGTQGAGLLKFDRERRRFIAYKNNPADSESIAENRVIALFEDREGNVWTGLGGKAPNRFAPTPSLFQTVSSNPDNLSSRSPFFVSAISEDRRGTVWVGTHDVLIRTELDTGQHALYRSGVQGAGSDVINIIEDGAGSLWLGTFNRGLSHLDPRTGRVTTYRHNSTDPHSLSNDVVSRLLMAHDGTLWAATWDGLNRFDASTGRFTTYRLEPQRNDLMYLELSEDREGTLWLGTHYSGIQRFDPATARFTVFEHHVGRLGTLSDNRVNSLHFDHTGAMWAGTQNGLNRFEPDTGTFTVFTTRDGLPGNAIGCILEDQHGDLWMSTNNGISRFNPAKRSFRNYSTADGLPGADLTGWGSCAKGQTGDMLFGGFGGATVFHPDRIVDRSDAPPVVLTDFRLSGNPVAIGDRPLKRAISYTRDLTLSHEQSIFSLTFAALSYSNPPTNRYRYTLDGLDRSWNQVGSDKRLATYTTLPAGTYTFRLQGATSNGTWSEPGVALRIEILPPWWNTWWFRAMYTTVLLLLLFAAYDYRLRQIARQFHMRLEERVGERTRIARELHDSLLQGFQGLMFRLQAVRDLLPERPTEAMRALDGALDRGDEAMTEGREAVQDLRFSALVGTDLVQSLAALGAELAHGEGDPSPTFAVIVEGAPRVLDPVLRDEVYRIAREALRNAVHHAQAHKIEAEVTFGDSLLRLRVRDDGNGIDPTIRDQGKRAGHFGLLGMGERARSFGGQLDVWSEHGAGTEVELRIPATVAYSVSSTHATSWFFRRKSEAIHGRQS
jgi:ligand-binding sensor domain-containing protein/signal transduction histidine kinase